MNLLELTSNAIRDLNRQKTLVIFPIAAIEQHGPHLPCGTDTLICDAISQQVQANCFGQTLRLPTQWIGASTHHLPLGSTLDCKLPIYTQLLCETLEPLLHDGFCRFLILNGHGGNIDPMRIALRLLQPKWPTALLAAASYWSIADHEIVSLLDGEDKMLGHACEAETSLIMHLRPELVKTEAIRSAAGWLPDMVDGMYLCRDMKQRTSAGATGRPDLATAEKGQKLFDAIVAKVSQAVKQLLDEPLAS